MEANPRKFQGILFRGEKQINDFKLSVNRRDVEFSRSMACLGICIGDTLTFDSHINDIYLKASRQISYKILNDMDPDYLSSLFLTGKFWISFLNEPIADFY